MENGHDEKLAEKLSGLDLNDKKPFNEDSLFHVMKAVEAAEATIKQQAEENGRSRSELQKTIEQLEKYKVESGSNPNASANEAANVNFFVTLNPLPSAASFSDNYVGPPLSLFSSPLSAISFSPPRHQLFGEYDSRLPQGFLLMPPVNSSNSLWKQDDTHKVREQEEEILQLRKQLAEFSVKAFDQQQQDLVDAASKALSYRQDVIEENIRLAYQSQAAQQERTTFISSLLPLLAEYSLQPPVPDAQSIVSNVKVLFKHMQEKLIVIESKLKVWQYQLPPWRPDVNHSNFAPQSPLHSLGAALPTSQKAKNGLELVPQPTYSQGKMQIISDAQKDAQWDLPGQHQGGLGGGIASKDLELDDLGRYSPIPSRTPTPNEISTQSAVTHSDTHTTRYCEETINKQVTFCDPVSNSEMDYPDAEGHQNEREPPSNWGSGNTPYAAADDSSSSYPPYPPPVLEEPSSYNTLLWVRHMEDGSVNYINGAKQPNYLVTADDVDTYLAIEVQPLDNRNRKGELVKVFANEHKKIACDPEMLGCIERTLYSGHASYKVSNSTGYLDIWGPATLAIKRDGYTIKCSGSNGVVVIEKFCPTTEIKITFGEPTEFMIVESNGVQRLLRADSSSTDISWYFHFTGMGISIMSFDVSSWKFYALELKIWVD
ncbi:Heat shock protein [Hibiscus syriacus]|uniref:Heat shock protein n=1 Tax=Hibiscus syriacus TaxID=106335 RepID=A0A6A2X9Q3_HIBSY|nr:Heat shock protein [Hibiscus syriacus]